MWLIILILSSLICCPLVVAQTKDLGAASDYTKEDFFILSDVAKHTGLLLEGMVEIDPVTKKPTWTVTPGGIANVLIYNIRDMSPTIYGACLAFEPDVYNNMQSKLPGGAPERVSTDPNGDITVPHTPFFRNLTDSGSNIYAPYAYRGSPNDFCKTRKGKCGIMDLAIGYDYTDPSTEWYKAPKDQYLDDLKLGATTFRGYWTRPYYDDGGGNANMVTYSYPVQKDGIFLGIATIDILVEKLCYGPLCDTIALKMIGVKNLCKSLFGVEVFVALSTIVFTIYKRNAGVIRASQKFFLILISLGTIISAISIYLDSFDDTETSPRAGLLGLNIQGNFGCNATVWFYCIGFVLTFSSLFAKLWRTKKVFNNKKLGKVSISDYDVLYIILSMCAAEIIVLAIWTTSSPLKYVRSEDGLEASCKSEGSLVYLAILGVYHVIILGYGNVLAYETRNVNAVFSESKFIMIAMIANLQVLFLGGCILVLVYSDPVTGMMIKALIIFLNDMTVQLLIFGPKVFYVIKGVEDDGTAVSKMLNATGKKVNPNSDSTTTTTTNITES